MPAPRVVAVAPGSAAARAGLDVGDEVVTLNGQVPRDVIQWRRLVDDADVDIEVRRRGRTIPVTVTKRDGEPLGAEVSSALFDQVRTCDNHCAFCFIYQLPKGLRPSLYLKDDDYRLSFLYGNFTTLTRFTEADLERVLLDHGVTVHGQVVVCPGVNDGAVLEDTLSGVLDEYPELASLCLVPLGLSRYNAEPDLRSHTPAEAAAVVDAAAEWQEIYLGALGRRLVHAADEYYLLAGRPFPDAAVYEGFPMHEDGVGMARTFERELLGQVDRPTGVQSGFFSWVDGAPAAGYRAPRSPGPATRPVDGPVAVISGEYGARVLRPLLDQLGRRDVRIVAVPNRFFGGNTAVTGLMVGSDIAPVLAGEPAGHRYLLPDVCLSEGRFLDGTTPAELPHPVEVVATDGIALRRALA